MKFYKKYKHVGYSYPSVPDAWVPIVEQAIIRIEKLMWPVWMPRPLKRLIHRLATGNSVYYIRSKFWYKIKNRLTKGCIITDIKSKYAGLRIYGYLTDEMEDIVAAAEYSCDITCERCGHRGQDVSPTDEGWTFNYCRRCKNELGYGEQQIL